MVEGTAGRRSGFLSRAGAGEGEHGPSEVHLMGVRGHWKRQHGNEGRLLTGHGTILGEDERALGRNGQEESRQAPVTH